MTIRDAVLAFVLATGSLVACDRSSLQPEETVEGCTDRIDNDGDRYVDCADQDCQLLVLCRSDASPPDAALPVDRARVDRSPDALAVDRARVDRSPDLMDALPVDASGDRADAQPIDSRSAESHPSCAGGPCCDAATGDPLPASVLCWSGNETQCLAFACGAGRQERTVVRYCDGASVASCSGSYQYGPWTSLTACPSSEVCSGSGACVPSPSCATCTGGPCCDTSTGKPRPSSFACSVSKETQCLGSGCGAGRQERTVTRYCDGQSASCVGSLQYGSWSALSACQATETCSGFGTCATSSTCGPQCSAKFTSTLFSQCGFNTCGTAASPKIRILVTVAVGDTAVIDVCYLYQGSLKCHIAAQSTSTSTTLEWCESPSPTWESTGQQITWWVIGRCAAQPFVWPAQNCIVGNPCYWYDVKYWTNSCTP